MTEYHDRASGPPRAQFDRALGQQVGELQETAREILAELGYVWLGDLSGWEVVPELRDAFADAPPLRLELRHRCGFALRQPFEGITGDGAAYVANIVTRLMEVAPGHVCVPHEPSPEHQARVARWAAAAGATPSGDVAQDQLAIVRAASRRLVDGPGCTPAVTEEPADVPVRRCIDGKWQTVEVTLSDFRANEGADGRQPFRLKPDPEPSE